ncbi:MurR/RpiR family transcriptional regulator [Lacticaseibacillus thailandensis]|uniref:MurR/RpiR family transcriptional regulator n=1 Tax=Lacticaseibacillus thailandensis TaxID=381741 RepID=UPI0006CFC85F|nr:MurR/RpiR family transcriptional regulator [Lacticaseibacillus thailandensis]
MSKFSASEQYVVDLIHRQRDHIMGMSIVEFAEFANVSTATIVRTMKKLGYSGYTDFRHSVSRQHEVEPAVLREADSNIRQVITANLREVQQTINQLDIATIEDSVQQFAGAQMLYIFARGLSEMIADEMALKFQLAGKYTQTLHDPNIIMTLAERVPTTACAIFISLNGETPELVTAARKLRAHGVPIVTITTNADASLAQYTDILLTGYKSAESYFPDYEVHSRLPVQVISRILLDAYVVRVQEQHDQGHGE